MDVVGTGEALEVGELMGKEEEGRDTEQSSC
jgi:hypothetical protein